MPIPYEWVSVMTHQSVEEWDIVGVVLKNQEVRDAGRNVAA